MPEKKDKPRSKILQQWDEIKDLSQYSRPEDVPTQTPQQKQRRESVYKTAQDHRALAKSAPRAWMRREHERKAEQYESTYRLGAITDAYIAASKAQRRKKKAEKDKK